MPRFFNKIHSYWLTTSYKTMYSTFLNQPNLINTSPTFFFVKFWMGQLRGRTIPHYMVVRDPYNRIVSCFADKFRRGPSCRTIDQGWEHCQQVCFRPLGIDQDAEFETIRKQLMSVSFEEFILNVLPVVWRKDPHFHPQSFLRHVRLKTIPLSGKIRFEALFRMEEDLPKLCESLDVDLSIHKQKSSHKAPAEYFSPATREVVNRIYAKDFEMGGYDVLNS